ncbi:hypothetical protein PM082_003582 [Marasmius tenuissimus]|nr:hypothetical protein PM082_003582 [Marasmius tenuissimus]
MDRQDEGTYQVGNHGQQYGGICSTKSACVRAPFVERNSRERSGLRADVKKRMVDVERIGGRTDAMHLVIMETALELRV